MDADGVRVMDKCGDVLGKDRWCMYVVLALKDMHDVQGTQIALDGGLLDL